MHMSPNVGEDAIRLLETDTRLRPVGEMLEKKGARTKDAAIVAAIWLRGRHLNPRARVVASS